MGHPGFFQQEDLVLLHGLYPNPFAELLHVYFTLRVDAAMRMDVYDVAGEPIWHGEMQAYAGKNLMDWRGENEGQLRVASGVYVIRLVGKGVDGTTVTIWERAVVSR